MTEAAFFDYLKEQKIKETRRFQLIHGNERKKKDSFLRFWK